MKKKSINKISKNKEVKTNKLLNSFSKNLKKFFKLNNLIKIILIFGLIFGFYYTQNSYSNNITLLAVSENSDDLNSIQIGSTLNLGLKIKPGSGKIFINLNTIEEIDTQISITNSQKIACRLFSLDCSNYNFYYEFSGSSIILKGPSASTAIAILTTKTILKEKIKNDVVITGSLNSGGLIGLVGGVDKKIEVANSLGFKKVIIPKFSKYNDSIDRNIKVIKVIDLIEAYNSFNSKNYKLKNPKINKTNYLNIMKTLGDNLCSRSYKIKSQINFSKILENSTEDNLRNLAKKTLNSSINAKINKNYYSQGSFCFNSNINYRILLEMQKNLTEKQLDSQILDLENKVNFKYINIISNNYKENITTINDFYVYLILNDRIEEAKKIIKKTKTKKKNKDLIKNILSNSSILNVSNISKTNLSILNMENKISKNNKLIYYSSAIERFNTVLAWELFIMNSGKKIQFNDEKIINACYKINKEINIKEQLLNKYKINFFKDEIKLQNDLNNPFSNKYYCVYRGLQTIGNINTVLNSVGITLENQKEYTKKINEFTQSKISLNSRGEFPLIPFIYAEYANDLFKNKDYSTSNLYSNYALVYSDLNLYLEDIKQSKRFSNIVLNDLFSNYLFFGAILIIIGFI